MHVFVYSLQSAITVTVSSLLQQKSQLQCTAERGRERGEEREGRREGGVREGERERQRERERERERDGEREGEERAREWGERGSERERRGMEKESTGNANNTKRKLKRTENNNITTFKYLKYDAVKIKTTNSSTINHD